MRMRYRFLKNIAIFFLGNFFVERLQVTFSIDHMQDCLLSKVGKLSTPSEAAAWGVLF